MKLAHQRQQINCPRACSPEYRAEKSDSGTFYSQQNVNQDKYEWLQIETLQIEALQIETLQIETLQIDTTDRGTPDTPPTDTLQIQMSVQHSQRKKEREKRKMRATDTLSSGPRSTTMAQRAQDTSLDW